jgi:hypothetical protein
MSPRVVRTKTTELTAVADGRFQLLARLTDVPHDCDWGPDGQGGVIHDFEVEGEIEGEALIVTPLHAVHPRGRRVDRCGAGCRAGDRGRVPRAGQGRACHRQRGASPPPANLR